MIKEGVGDVTEANVVIGASNALALGATDGFLYLPSMAGVPTGDITDFTGKFGMVFDSTNNKIMVNKGGTSWVDVGASGSEVFTWTANHSMAGFKLISTGSQTSDRINLPNGSSNAIGFENNAGDGNIKLYSDSQDFLISTAEVLKIQQTNAGIASEFRMDYPVVVNDGSGIGRLKATGFDDASALEIYGFINFIVESDAVSTGPEGGMQFVCDENGTTEEYMYLNEAGGNVIDFFRPLRFASGMDIILNTGTGTKIGTGTTQKLGFWNATAVVQPVHIVDPTGGGTVDAEARTAIDAILAQLATLGLQASS